MHAAKQKTDHEYSRPRRIRSRGPNISTKHPGHLNEGHFGCANNSCSNNSFERTASCLQFLHDHNHQD